MHAISKILQKTETGALMFECPGCGIPHVVNLDPSLSQHWGWNGDAERPTFTPSILVHYPHWEPPANDDNLDLINRGIIVQSKVNGVCHSFVTDGKIQFLTDCTHALAGQTVAIPDWEE